MVLEPENKITLRTHKKINQKFCGKLIEIGTEDKKYAKIKFDAIQEMAVDDYGLIHGGFIFGAADFCAMATINHPNVLLSNSKCRFLAPVKIGDTVIFESEILFDNDKKQEINVVGKIDDLKVFEGLFGAVILPKHILKTKINTD